MWGEGRLESVLERTVVGRREETTAAGGKFLGGGIVSEVGHPAVEASSWRDLGSLVKGRTGKQRKGEGSREPLLGPHRRCKSLPQKDHIARRLLNYHQNHS